MSSAADAYAATLFGLTGQDIPYVRIGAEMGLGRDGFEQGEDRADLGAFLRILNLVGI